MAVIYTTNEDQVNLDWNHPQAEKRSHYPIFDEHTLRFIQEMELMFGPDQDVYMRVMIPPLAIYKEDGEFYTAEEEWEIRKAKLLKIFPPIIREVKLFNLNSRANIRIFW